MRVFRANASSAVELAEINVFAMVLAERSDGTGVRLEIQRAMSFDDQDRAHGQGTYCLCTEDGITHYGGVVHWAITQGSLEIQLDAEAQDVLGTEGFTIAIRPEDVAIIRDGLKRVLGKPTSQ